MSLKFNPKVQAIQLLSNKKGGSCLKPDGLKGKYTNEVTWMLKKVMGLPINTIITKDFTKRLVEAPAGSILPESFEDLRTPMIYKSCDEMEQAPEKIYNWIKSKKRRTLLTLADIKEIFWISRFSFNPLHCIAHLINESAWGTSYRIKYYNNGFGIGIYDSGDKFKLKYLTIPTSAYEWGSLLKRRYFPRGQINEQLLNLDYKRYGKHPEWFNLKEIPKGRYPYATSQSKSVSCGLLVWEMRELLNN